MANVAVNETRRVVHFNDGQSANFHNVTSFNADGSFLRLECDEGYILINTPNINYIRIPDKTERVT